MLNPGYRRCCPGCTSWFVICQSCDRWHWYCSEACAEQARRMSQRRASQKYRRTARGLASNRKSQKKHRLNRHKKKNVSHHSYESRPPSSTIEVAPDGQADFENQRRKESIDEVNTTFPTKGPTKAPFNSPTAASIHIHPGLCRVCRRVITHLVVSDVLGRPRSERGPPCNPMKPSPRFVSNFMRST